MAIYQPKLRAGGAERVTITLLKHLDRSRFAPMLIMRAKVGALLDQVPADVPLYSLSGRRVRSAWYALAQLLMAARPDVLLSMSSGGNVTAALGHAASRTRSKLILVEHNALTEVAKHQRFPVPIVLVKKLLYRRADRIVGVSNGVGRDLITALGISSHRVTTIYNPVIDDILEELSFQPVVHPWFHDSVPIILAAGRLVDQKDYPVLLRAFAQLRGKLAARLVVLGDGELRDKLGALSSALGIANDVSFLGSVQNPFQFMRRCTIFALSSKYEGFGNVLVEAMACGVPVVSTDCAYGPSEIITHGSNGLLVPVGDARRLADAISSLLTDEQMRRRIAEQGRRDAQRFAASVIVRQYEDLVAKEAKQRNRS